jgi:hypothetical protein
VVGYCGRESRWISSGLSLGKKIHREVDENNNTVIGINQVGFNQTDPKEALD